MKCIAYWEHFKFVMNFQLIALIFTKFLSFVLFEQNNFRIQIQKWNFQCR